MGPVTVELYGQMMNAFNRARFVDFDPNFSSQNFGRAGATSLPRFIQLGTRVSF